MFEDICKEVAELHERKNHDYGDSFGQMFNEFLGHGESYAMSYAIGHLQEKLNRIKSLTYTSGMVNGESLDDSLIDLMAYAGMTLEMRRKNSVS